MSEFGPSAPEALARNYSQERLELLGVAIEKIKAELAPEELAGIRALIVYGSTSRGTATEESDLDLFIDWDEKVPFNPAVLNKVNSIIDDVLPDIPKEWGCKPILSKGASANHLTKRGSKHPELPPSWKVIYAQSHEAAERLNRVLLESAADNEQYLARKGRIMNPSRDGSG